MPEDRISLGLMIVAAIMGISCRNMRKRPPFFRRALRKRVNLDCLSRCVFVFKVTENGAITSGSLPHLY